MKEGQKGEIKAELKLFLKKILDQLERGASLEREKEGNCP